MLQAIENNKAGRNFSNEEINWRNLFTSSEDSLTSSVLGTLLYLPDTIFWSILYSATNCLLFTQRNNSIEDVVFWPSWNAKDTFNKNRVEPDVLIRTTAFDLIIEVKKEDCSHDKTQWLNECISYKNEYAEDKKLLLFLALGGEIPFKYEKDSIGNMDVQVTACKWREVLFSVTREIDKYQQAGRVSSNLNRIFTDIILSFRIHGFLQIEWLHTLTETRHLNINLEAATWFDNAETLFTNTLTQIPLHYSISEQSFIPFQTALYE